VPGPSSSCVPWSNTPPGVARCSPSCAAATVAFRPHKALGTRNEIVFEAACPTAHTLARLRFAGAVTATVARLATGLGGLTPGRAGFAPAGRQTEFHRVIASSTPFRPAVPGRTMRPNRGTQHSAAPNPPWSRPALSWPALRDHPVVVPDLKEPTRPMLTAYADRCSSLIWRDHAADRLVIFHLAFRQDLRCSVETNRQLALRVLDMVDPSTRTTRRVAKRAQQAPGGWRSPIVRQMNGR